MGSKRADMTSANAPRASEPGQSATQPATPERSSRLPGFYRLSVEERRTALTKEGWLSREAAQLLARHAGFEEAIADTMSENVVGVHGLPLGVALNFRVNGRDHVAPMSVEEPSVVAAASGAARIALAVGGYTAEADAPLMIAQVQLIGVPDVEAARQALTARSADLLQQANDVVPQMVRRGGGVREIEFRLLEPAPVDRPGAGSMCAVHLIVDTRDAMGANLLNTLAEAMAAPIQSVCGGRIGLRILSNLADRRCVRVSVRLPVSQLAQDGYSGERVRDGIVNASRFAEVDPYRACTHNKGIMNGVDAVILATGNDWRAAEAGAHAYAARSGVYRPLAVWTVGDNGDLIGKLEMPLALGIVGGAARAHPGVRLAIELAGVSSAQELAQLAASVGLASNFAALRALATEGIQKGHMALHARSVAAEVGAVGSEVELLALELAKEGDFRPERARTILHQMRLHLVVHER
jgi:hydroxymethylglutaryl-CoA reductase